MYGNTSNNNVDKCYLLYTNNCEFNKNLEGEYYETYQKDYLEDVTIFFKDENIKELQESIDNSSDSILYQEIIGRNNQLASTNNIISTNNLITVKDLNYEVYSQVVESVKYTSKNTINTNISLESEFIDLPQIKNLANRRLTLFISGYYVNINNNHNYYVDTFLNFYNNNDQEIQDKKIKIGNLFKGINKIQKYIYLLIQIQKHINVIRICYEFT